MLENVSLRILFSHLCGLNYESLLENIFSIPVADLESASLRLKMFSISWSFFFLKSWQNRMLAPTPPPPEGWGNPGSAPAFVVQ